MLCVLRLNWPSISLHGVAVSKVSSSGGGSAGSGGGWLKGLRGGEAC